ncbi:MAG: tRNA (adenosine(37)-N6)-threonylcarbamoyltransferase complex ATPase subunit type 1 TsaE [Clostridia bacterium]|nr:tRNA (adenosine(37)-N6)-threonylcarbamoyltransferase complex ATPase subunit type 1 TsaE [Clostridia bacterium]
MEINDLKQTKDLATAFANAIKPPMIVLLKGDLGAGKTTFVKEVVRALGCEDLVTSPTFTLLNTYNAKFPVYHFDMYRLSSAEEAMGVGFEEYFDKRTLDGVCFVEWPENVDGLITKVDYEISITKNGVDGRIVVIEEKSDACN